MLLQACLIAADYRMRYEMDVVVDVVGYRRCVLLSMQWPLQLEGTWLPFTLGAIMPHT